ncbi:MAG: hypothetical protein ACOH1I_10715 [Gallionellaceae bacterium]|jgi:hypothetical protein
MNNNKFLLGALALVCTLYSAASFAVSDEVQVYTDDMNTEGEFGVELHLNYVVDGEKQAGYAGAATSQHMVQATPEFSYGITKNWEAGMYVPVAREENGTMYGNGLRLRMKYIATPEQDAMLFWGVNLEYGYSNLRVSESEWGMELRPIFGYRTDNWLFSFNPILNMDMSDNFNHSPQFEPALKVSRKVAAGVQAGLEYYGEYGYANNLLPEGQRINYLYAAVDVEKNGYDVNFGVGRGDSNAPDSWIAKAIIAFPFK